MNIQQAYHSVMKTMDEIQILQENHIQSFNTQLMPDLETHCQERKHIFDRFYTEAGTLISNLETILDKDRAKEVVESVNNRIAGLLAQNSILSQKALEHKNRIQESLNNLSQGKRAMTSYGTPSYIQNRPRAIRITN